eukprot:12401465-Karenia_brevis.AAC.1
MEITQFLAEGDLDHGLAFTIQCAKALNQVGLNQVGLLLVPAVDPIGEPVFGGQEKELAAIHRYRKALKDLKDGHVKLGHGQGEEEEQGTKPPKKPKGGGKGDAD